MIDDDEMDRLLRATLATTPPRLSAAFDDRVRCRVRPRRLTPRGRTLLALYAVAAAAASLWLLGDVPPPLLARAAAVGLPIAAAAGAYGRRLAA